MITHLSMYTFIFYTMKICKRLVVSSKYSNQSFLLVAIFVLSIELVSAVQYNQPCTFSFGTCDWNLGRRWHITTLDADQKGFRKVFFRWTLNESFFCLLKFLIADAESKEDKRIGFTDALMSSWLQLSSLCSFDIRLTFKYSISNRNDFIEIYFLEKNQTKMNLLGQWKNFINKNHSFNQPSWQQANITFKAAEQFQV